MTSPLGSTRMLLGLAVALACTPSPTIVDDTDASSSDGGSTGMTESSTGDGDDSSTDSDSTADRDTDTDTSGGECGDGVLDEGEACDDGNLDPADGCSPTCELEPAGPIECGGLVLACGDTLDNDMDGLVDLDDPECTSPCDDVEAGLCIGLHVVNFNCTMDCAWDYNGGVGDDGCQSNLMCDPLEPGLEIGCEHDPNFPCDPPSQACLDGCGPLIPNGCDCYGCCELDGQTVFLPWFEGPDCCTVDDLGACASCTLNLDCFNPCDAEGCEICFGQGPEDLAPGCDEPACPAGKDPCTSQLDCADGWFCQTGCCTRISASVGD